MKKLSTLKTLLVGLLALGATSAWADETKTSVYSNDFSESSDWISKGKTDGWTCNPGETTANSFNSQVIGVGSGTGDMGLVSPSMSFAEGITVVDVEMKFKMDACTQGKSSGIEFITSDVNINNGYVSSGTPFFAINASANGNGYWGTIIVGGNNYTSVLNQTGTYENNSLNRNTTGIITLNARFNFTTKTATFSMSRGGSEIVASTTVTFANTNATTLDRIFIHAGKTYGGVTIDDVKVYSVVSEEVETTYLATFTETNDLKPTVTIYSDSERTEEVTNGLLEDNTTYYYKATLTGYNDYLGSFTVSGENPSVSYTMEAKSLFTYSVNAINSNNELIKNIAEGENLEGTSVTVPYNKYIFTDGKLLVASGKDDNNKQFSTTFTLNDNYEENITYKDSGIKDIVFYVEGEDIEGCNVVQAGTIVQRGSGMKGGAGTDKAITTLSEGRYIVTTQFGGKNNQNYVIKAGEDAIISATTNGATLNVVSSSIFALNGETTLTFTGGNATPTAGNAHGIDFIYVERVPETVDVTISDAGYATYINSKYPLDFSNVEGLTAYTANADGDQVNFTEATKVPANTGVLLKGAAKTYNVPIVTDGVEATSLLIGGTTAPAGSFVLMKVEDKVGFYKTKEEFTLTANTAYIYIPGTASAREFIAIDGEATGISAVKSADKSSDTFNLNGQRVNKAQKGLYIQNGKKVVVK